MHAMDKETNMARDTTAHAPVMDDWDDAGPFLYRILPETGLDAFFNEKRDNIRISESLGKWWVGEDRVMGQDAYDTLREAKAAGDVQVAELENGLTAMLLNEAGLNADEWRVDLQDGISFYANDGDQWIYGDTREGMAGHQRWEAMRGDDLVSKGHRTIAEAIASFATASATTA